MLYHLFIWLREQFNLAGAGVFQYISFRAGMAIILSLIITLVYGKRLIRFLQKKQIGETIRDLGLDGEKQKSGTPTMGGLIIIGGILIPTLLFARITNVYVIMMILSTVWLGLIGFLDCLLYTSMLFIAVLAVIYITNNSRAAALVRELDKTNKELKELKWEYLDVQSRLIYATSESQLLQRSAPLGLQPLDKPAFEIRNTVTIKEKE